MLIETIPAMVYARCPTAPLNLRTGLGKNIQVVHCPQLRVRVGRPSSTLTIFEVR